MTVTVSIAIGLAVLFFIVTYNILVGRKNEVENVFGSVDAYLKKRYDLIPNLIDTVQAYMTHERELLTQITELRAKASTGTLTSDEKVSLENQLARMMGRIMVAVENYPDLKASENFLQLQAAMNEVEEQLSAARRAYNAVVTSYNNATEMFPANLVAKIIGYARKQILETPEHERANYDAGKLFS